VPGLIEGLRVVQGLRVVPVILYRYSMKVSLKKAHSPGTTGGQIRLGTTRSSPPLSFSRIWAARGRGLSFSSLRISAPASSV
jgi:hypothetical protein